MDIACEIDRIVLQGNKACSIFVVMFSIHLKKEELI